MVDFNSMGILFFWNLPSFYNSEKNRLSVLLHELSFILFFVVTMGKMLKNVIVPLLLPTALDCSSPYQHGIIQHQDPTKTVSETSPRDRLQGLSWKVEAIYSSAIAE